jgi:lysophospholipase L1-like esterase
VAPQAGTGSVTSGYKPKCLTKGTELALVGDSWVHYDLGEVLAPRLEKRAKAAGALPSGGYNDQAIAGTSMANGGLGLIPDQWPSVKTAARIAGTTTKFVVMDGGGNDVLLGNTICLDNGKMRDQDPTCQKTVADALAAGKKLVEQMKADGVGQVIYYYYPHVPAGGWDVLDYALPMVKSMCEANSDETFQCYFIDTRDAFQGPGNTGVAMKSLILPDDIHPNAMGDEVLADLVWKTMKDNCMAQTEASGEGCCTP